MATALLKEAKERRAHGAKEERAQEIDGRAPEEERTRRSVSMGTALTAASGATAARSAGAHRQTLKAKAKAKRVRKGKVVAKDTKVCGARIAATTARHPWSLARCRTRTARTRMATVRRRWTPTGNVIAAVNWDEQDANDRLYHWILAVGNSEENEWEPLDVRQIYQEMEDAGHPFAEQRTTVELVSSGEEEKSSGPPELGSSSDDEL